MRLLRALPLLLSVACGPDADVDRVDDPCQPGGEPSLRIGGSERGFLLLEAGDPIELVHGPQGGYHVEIGLQATHLDTSGRQSGRIEARIGGELLARSAPYLELRCNGPVGALQSWGSLLVFDATPDELHAATADITAEVTDAAGTVVTSAIQLVIHDPTLE